MKRLAASAPTLAMLVAAACGNGDARDRAGVETPTPEATATIAAPSGTTVIEMLGEAVFRFEPEHVDIATGGSVTWVWVQGIHNVVGDGPIAHKEVINERGYLYTTTFPEAGTYAFTCEVHRDDMNGTVTVS
jgi:plastocyanin